MTNEEYNEKQGRLNALHQLLDNTDYKTFQYSEGVLSDNEFEEVRSQRQAWRVELRQLRTELENSTIQH